MRIVIAGIVAWFVAAYTKEYYLPHAGDNPEQLVQAGAFLLVWFLLSMMVSFIKVKKRRKK